MVERVPAPPEGRHTFPTIRGFWREIPNNRLSRRRICRAVVGPWAEVGMRPGALMQLLGVRVQLERSTLWDTARLEIKVDGIVTWYGAPRHEIRFTPQSLWNGDSPREWKLREHE